METNQIGSKPLTLKEERFAEHVVAGMSGKAAIKAAGYGGTDKSQYTMASKLGKKVEIVAKIAELRKPQTAKAVLSKDAKLRFYEKLIATPVSQLTPDSPFCTEYRVKVTEVPSEKKGGRSTKVTETIVKGMCRHRALEMHSKLQGDFAPDKVEMETGPKTLDELKARAAKLVSALDLRNLQRREARKAKDDL